MSETNDKLNKFLAGIDRRWAHGYRAAQQGSPKVKAEFLLAQVEELFSKIEAIQVPYAQKMMAELPYGALTDPNFIINNPVPFSLHDSAEKAPKLPSVKKETKDALRVILHTIAASPAPRGNPELFNHLDMLQTLCKSISATYPPENSYYGDDHPRNGRKAKQAADIWDQLVNIRNAAIVLGLGTDGPVPSHQQSQAIQGRGA